MICLGGVAALGESAIRDAIALVLVLAGAFLAIRVLAAREQEFRQAHRRPRRGNRVADTLMVTVGAAGGFLAAGGNKGTWVALALACALVHMVV